MRIAGRVFAGLTPLVCGLLVVGCGGTSGLSQASVAPPGVHASAPGHIEFYVATYGSDLDEGTKARPFATLERARDAIREIKATQSFPNRAGPSPGRLSPDRLIPVSVWIRGGTFHRTSTFKLTEQDSGTEQAPILYRSCNGEDVRLVGGVELARSWCEPVKDEGVLARMAPAARGRVLKVDLKDRGIADHGELSISGPMLELFCRGKRLPLARWPNKGWAYIRQVVEVGKDGTSRLVDGNKQGTTFQYDGDRPKRWLKADQMALHGFWWFGWTDEHVTIKRIDAAQHLIELDRVPSGGIRKEQWYCALNLLEEIDQPGEWFLDRGTGVLYVWPPDDWPDYPILLSTLTEPLLVLNGTSHVTVRGLTLEVTRGVAIVLGGGSHNRLAGCVVRCVGSDAIVMDGGKHNGLVGCDIYQVGSTGIRLTGGNRSTLEPSGNCVVNNDIHHYAQRKKVYQPAVRMYGCGHRVAHNHIHDAPHQAIGYDGNEHVIEFNEIDHVVLESADAGVLYSGCDWTFRGNVVRHNFIHHIPHGPGLGTVGVYLDDCHCSTMITGNVFYDMLKPTFIGGGRDNVITNNIFVRCEIPVHLDNRGLRWDHFRPGGPMYEHLKQVRYDQPPWSERYPELARILDECPQAPLGNVLMRNVSYKSTWRDPEKRCRETSGKNIDRPYMRIADNYVTDEDPGFVDAANMDFQLRDDSVVYKKIPGFKKIPFQKIGPYEDEYRATWPVPKRRP